MQNTQNISRNVHIGHRRILLTKATLEGLFVVTVDNYWAKSRVVCDLKIQEIHISTSKTFLTTDFCPFKWYIAHVISM